MNSETAPGGGVGRLLIIGGREDKEGEREILRRLVEIVDGRRMVLVTLASTEGDAQWGEYREVFRDLGLTNLVRLHAETREELMDGHADKALEGAQGVFFTGGDQLKITALLGGSPTDRRIHEIHRAGGVIAGTSAGASAMCDTMLVAGKGNQSSKTRGSVMMAPGLALIRTAIIDQHFAERGRIGRLLAAVAENPRLIGIGIDENTAILVEGNRTFEVIGEGAVYVVDGTQITSTNISEADLDHTLFAFGMRLHLLGRGCRYDLESNRPSELESHSSE